MARADAKGSMGSSGMDPAIMDPLPRLLTAVQDDDCLMVRRILGRGDFGVVDVNQMDVFGNTPMVRARGPAGARAQSCRDAPPPHRAPHAAPRRSTGP